MLFDAALEKAIITATLDGHKEPLSIPLEYFADPECAIIWKAIQALLLEGLDYTDRILVVNETGLPSMEVPAERYQTENLPEYIERLRRHWMARFIRDIEPEIIAAELIQSMQFAMYGQSDIQSIGEILASWQAQDGLYIAVWPLKSLQSMLSGIEQSDLIVIAGAPSSGKTSFVLQTILANQHKGRSILFFSMDTSRAKLIRRIINKLCGVDITTIKMLENDLSKGTPTCKVIQGAMEKMKDFSIFINDNRTITAPMIVAKAKQLADTRGRLDLVVVDFLQLLTLPGKATEAQELDKATQQLRAMAGDLKCAVIGLSQLNREGASAISKDQKSQHLRGSGGLEQNADVVMIISRPGIEAANALEQRATIRVTKSKDTAIGPIECIFETQRLVFKDRI